MTLILNAFNTDYVVMTSDSNLIYNDYDSSGERITNNEASSVGEQGFKVVKVSDRVLYGMAGIKDVHDLILERLLKKVKKNDDLKKVSRLVEEICKELEKSNRLFQFVMKGPGFGTYIAGFYRNGRTGRVEIRGFGELEVITVHEPSWGMLPPPFLGKEVNPEVFRIGEKNDFMGSLATCHKVHALMAYAVPDLVTNDCTVYALVKEGKKFLFNKQLYDTSELFEAFPSKEDVVKFITGE